jgi:hypothetical protein
MFYIAFGGGGLDLELYRVDPSKLDCELTPFAHADGWQLCFHGSAFAADPGSSTGESLFFHAHTCLGPGTPVVDPFLGVIDPATSSDRRIASWTMPAQASTLVSWPMTGTAGGDLYTDYTVYPNLDIGTDIGQVDLATGAVTTRWQLTTVPALDQETSTRSFAFWGGDFYLFIEQQTSPLTQVVRFRPADASLVTVAQFDVRAWGAAVSTCAPLQ